MIDLDELERLAPVLIAEVRALREAMKRHI